jgi:glycosyltransferase involved in cell wall biosynthesis
MNSLRGQGSALVGRELLQAFADDEAGHHYLAWVPRQWGVLSTGAGEGRCSKIRMVPCRAGLLSKGVVDQLLVRLALRTLPADRLFSLGDTSLAFCSPVRHLLLVQQAFLAYPRSSWDFEVDRAFLRRVRLMQVYLSATLAAVDRVTVQSEHMQDAFCRTWRLPRDRVVVVPSAVSSLVLHRATAPVPQRCGAMRLVYVAGPDPHKNHKVLVPMVAELVRRKWAVHCHLTLHPGQCPPLVDEAIKARVRDHFVFEGPLDTRGSCELLGRADIALNPSLLESFGINYWDALALGRPTVAADTAHAHEALGDAAVYAKPHSGRDWADKVEALLADTTWAATLSARSRSRFASCHQPWSQIARCYLQLLEQL